MDFHRLVSSFPNNLLCIILFCLICQKSVLAQEFSPVDSIPPNPWVDSVLNSLSPDERIAQLLVVRANNPKQPYFTLIQKYIREYNIGGVCFFGGNPTAQALQTNTWQKIARTPLLVTIDGEWGLGMRLDSVVSFPYQMTLGAIADTSLIREMGEEIARECRRLGIHINFAPVVDINSNPGNPVIHMRSFGEERERVAAAGTAYMLGMQHGGILATAKHFPGHGDTDSDSHYTLPLILHDRPRLDSVELYPFRSLINEGLSGIMIAHLYIPSLDPKPNLASTLSEKIVTGLLREEMGFKGLIVTDALDMKGVTLNDEPGDIELKAFLAGNDILLLSADVPAAISRISNAVKQGLVTQEEIDDRCKRVLEYKYRAGLSLPDTIRISGILEDINGQKQELINYRLYSNAITLVRNDQDLIPVQRLDTLSIASVSIGYGTITPFQERLSYYAPVTHFSLGREPSAEEISSLAHRLNSFDLVIISIQNTGIWTSKRYGISQEAINLVTGLQQKRNMKVILDLFASPYALGLFEPKSMMASGASMAIVMSYQDHPVMQNVSAQAIFGGIAFRGMLPVTASPAYPSGTGIRTEAVRLEYTIPETIGIRSSDLFPIDSIVEDAIAKKVFPGCQVMAIRKGKVIFLKSYGFHTYDNQQAVTDFDLYDIASLTKITASTLSVMKLDEQDKINLDQVLSHYLPYVSGTNKGTMVIREVLAHQARLKSWIPFYKTTVVDGKLDPSIYQSTRSQDFPTRVAENIFIKKDYDRVLLDTIIQSRLLKTSTYKYSDLGLFFIKDMIEANSGVSLDEYAKKQFWSPLGLSTMGYLPRKTFPLTRIVPTELDLEFRMQLLHGDVHDPAAAMMGGVAGHAGVFSNANDLGIIGQMLLQGGEYGGIRFLEPSTIQEYTRQQFPLNDNRRGIGFDRPAPLHENNGPCCKSASQQSYGHTGFTGTYLWIDPEKDLVFVFLSNRVYPSSKVNKLAQLDIRPKIQQVFYDAIEKSRSFAH